jgi:hypothetical protein
MGTKQLRKKTTKTGRLSVFLLMLAFFISTFNAGAQCWHWAINMGGTNYESPTSISVGPDGNSAITGEFTGTFILGSDTLTASSFRDVFTAIVDSNGAVLKGMAGVGDGVENIGNGIATDTNGNIFITGNFTDTITFDDVPLVSAGNGDIFIVKYDASGNLLWARRAGGGSDIYANDIAVDPAGNCYIIGEFYDSASFDGNVVYSTIAQDVFTAKYDPDGNGVWAASSGGLSGDWGTGIAVDSLGNVFIAGYFQSQFVFNETTHSSEGNRDVFMAMYDVSGSPQWAVTGGGSGNDFFNKVAVDATGSNIYATGEFESVSALIGGITLQNANTSPPRRDILLMSFDASGAAQWGISAGSMEHDYANDVTVDDNGDVYITGTFNDTIVFNDITLINTSGDLYLAKLDQSGNALWAKMPEANTALAEGRSVTTYGNRPLIAGGLVAGTGPPILVFDDDTLISNGSTDAFIAKIGSPCAVATAVEDHFDNPVSLSVYPNPFQDRLTIRLEGRVQGPVDLKIYNLQGGLVMSDRSYAGENVSIRTDQLPSGVYFLHLRTGNIFQSVKLIKMQE